MRYPKGTKGALEARTVYFTRHVWALVTKNPQIMLSELAVQTGVTKGRCRYALQVLARQGYVERVGRARRGLKVLVPFGVME